MSPPLTALPDRPPRGAHRRAYHGTYRIGCTRKRRRVKEIPANAATAEKRNGQNPALPDGGRYLDETALRCDTTAFRRNPAFRCGGAP